MSIKKYNRAQRAIQELLEDNLEMEQIIAIHDAEAKAKEDGGTAPSSAYKIAQHFAKVTLKHLENTWSYPEVKYDDEDGYDRDFERWSKLLIAQFTSDLVPDDVSKTEVIKFIDPVLKEAYKEAQQKARLEWLHHQE